MAKKKSEADPWADPAPYDGPIQRLDGRRPYNRFLWPTEWWWANRELHDRIDPMWKFGIVALWNGEFAVEGLIWNIEENERRYSWTRKEGQLPRRNNFPTRAAAVRTSAAELIRLIRAARKWKRDTMPPFVATSPQQLIDWVRHVVARETAAPEPIPINLKPLPEPRRKTGLPLFDQGL